MTQHRVFRRLPSRVHSTGLALAIIVVLAGCGTVDRDDLSSYVGQLHSTAAEGMLLAGEAAKGGPPVVFVWMHSGDPSPDVMPLSWRSV